MIRGEEREYRREKGREKYLMIVNFSHSLSPGQGVCHAASSPPPRKSHEQGTACGGEDYCKIPLGWEGRERGKERRRIGGRERGKRKSKEERGRNEVKMRIIRCSKRKLQKSFHEVLCVHHVTFSSLSLGCSFQLSASSRKFGVQCGALTRFLAAQTDCGRLAQVSRG